MTSREPLPFDPILRAAALWDERIGPSRTMAAVTSVMRVQQILLSAVDGALRPHGLTFARYEALVLLSFSRHGRLPMRVMGERLQLHPTSVTSAVDSGHPCASIDIAVTSWLNDCVSACASDVNAPSWSACRVTAVSRSAAPSIRAGR